jgi:hypothetical protein
MITSYRSWYSFYTNINDNTTLRRPTVCIHLVEKTKKRTQLQNSCVFRERPKLTGTYSCDVTRQNTRKFNRASGQYECTKILLDVQPTRYRTETDC